VGGEEKLSVAVFLTLSKRNIIILVEIPSAVRK
jgi:hypothetical protein